MKEILDILEKNARISISDLAKSLGKEEKEIESIVKSYEKKGIILGYKTIINRELLKEEKKVCAIIEVKIQPQKGVGFDAVAARIYNFSEVRSCYLLSGTYELLLAVEGKDLHSISNFVAEKLAPLASVKGTTTHFLLKKYKEDGTILKEKDMKRLNISI